MMMTFLNYWRYNGFVSLLLLLLMSNRVQGGAFVGRGADALLRQSWASNHRHDVDHRPLFSTIHHPENGDELLFLNVEMEEHAQQHESPSLPFPVFPAAISAVLLSVLIAAASSSGQDAASLDLASQTGYPVQSTRHDTTISISQQQAQPAVEENQVVWVIDGSEGYFFF